MPLSNARRPQVFEQARAQWGDEAAGAPMDMLVPAGQEMATGSDVARAEVALHAELDRATAALRAELRGEIAPLASRSFVLGWLITALIPLYVGVAGLYVMIAMR